MDNATKLMSALLRSFDRWKGLVEGVKLPAKVAKLPAKQQARCIAAVVALLAMPLLRRHGGKAVAGVRAGKWATLEFLMDAKGRSRRKQMTRVGVFGFDGLGRVKLGMVVHVWRVVARRSLA